MNLVLVLGTIAFLALFYSWTSRINGFFFFGRTVDPELRASDEGRAITRGYLAAILAATVAALLTAWAAHRIRPSLTGLGILVVACSFCVVFARANRKTLELTGGQAAPGREAASVQVDLAEPPAYWIPGLFATLLPGLFALATLITAFLLTRHGGGFATWWTQLLDSLGTRHLDSLFGMTMGMLTAALILLLSFRSNARLRTRMAQYTIRASVVMAWIAAVAIPIVLIVNAQDVHLTRIAVKIVIGSAVSVALASIFWNQARSRRFVPPSAELGADDRWRWGLFYVNRNDPALFVQSRCGAGYTFNYGKAAAWPITAVVWGYLIVMIFIAPQTH